MSKSCGNRVATAPGPRAWGAALLAVGLAVGGFMGRVDTARAEEQIQIGTGTKRSAAIRMGQG